MEIRNKLFLIAVLALISGVMDNHLEAESQQFLYLSDQRIVTLETVDKKTVIVNYINLATTFEVFESRSVVILDESGKAFRSHLVRAEDPETPEETYEVSDLLKPGAFLGYEVVGDFGFSGPVKVYLKVAGRILQLEPIEASDFEIVVARIGELDFALPDKKLAIQRAGFRRGFGDLFFTGSEEALALEEFFREEDVVPPIPISTPQPRLPSSEAHLPDPVVVSVKAVVGKAGGLRNITAVEGVNEKLDRIAVETVRNSWEFLPAISGKEVAEAELRLNVVFQR